MLSLSKRIIPRLLTQQNIFQLYLHEYQAYDLLKKYQVPLVPVHHLQSRVLEPILLKMHLQLRKESWLLRLKSSLLSILLSKRKSTLEAEEKEPLNSQA